MPEKFIIGHKSAQALHVGKEFVLFSISCTVENAECDQGLVPCLVDQDSQL